MLKIVPKGTFGTIFSLQVGPGVPGKNYKFDLSFMDVFTHSINIIFDLLYN